MLVTYIWKPLNLVARDLRRNNILIIWNALIEECPFVLSKGQFILHQLAVFDVNGYAKNLNDLSR